ncbi:MAG: hypothetical protein IBJ11_02325 [Phycisphaerales bacterium]|nr:hypothetical protein [Phycisphaerales bacterium]
MDDRREGVQIGAGLQESRLNQDLIDFLKKWGPRMLWGVLIVVAGYLAFDWWQRQRVKTLDEGFTKFNAAVESRSPEVLLRVASDYRGQGSVWELATKEAARIYLASAQMEVKPGTPVMGGKPEDRITAEQAKELYQKARGLMSDLLATTKDRKDLRSFAQEARWGIATASIGLGDVAAAEQQVKDYVAEAERDGLKLQAEAGRNRLKLIQEVRELKPLVSKADLPAAAPTGPTGQTGATGAAVPTGPQPIASGTMTVDPTAKPVEAKPGVPIIDMSKVKPGQVIDVSKLPGAQPVGGTSSPATPITAPTGGTGATGAPAPAPAPGTTGPDAKPQ